MHKHLHKKPSKWVNVPCPCCDGKVKVINGQYLRHLRELSQIDQRTFGSKTNSSGPYISDIERNRRECPPDILREYLKLE